MSKESEVYANAEFKRWLALYFIEKGNWKVTDKAIEECGTDATPKQTMEFAEDYSSREREERTVYRVGLTLKEKKKIAHTKIADMIDEEKAEELYDNGYITYFTSWKDKTTGINAIRKLVEILDKDPRDVTVEDFYGNRLAGLLNRYYTASPYEAMKEAFPGLSIKPWEMATTPKGFCSMKENRVAAVKWLVEKLGKDPMDLTQGDFEKNRLRGLLDYYNKSPYTAITEAFPGLSIKPWEMATTPKGFCSMKENRVAAVKWLVEKLGKDPMDLTQGDFYSNKLTGLINHHYSASPYVAITEAFPEMDIKPWEMKKTPDRIFDEKKNRIMAVKWLVEKLRKDPRDLMERDFGESRLFGLLDYYNNSPYAAITEAFPGLSIKPWEMATTPKGFCSMKENRVAAVKWLVEKLGKDPMDLTQGDFEKNRLGGLLHDYYKNSPYEAVKETFSRIDIKPWEMKFTPKGFFDDKKNRVVATKWLVKKLKKDPRDLTAEDFHSNKLAGLLCNYYKNSPYEAMKEPGLVTGVDEHYMRKRHGTGFLATPPSKEVLETAKKIERNATKQKAKGKIVRKTFC